MIAVLNEGNILSENSSVTLINLLKVCPIILSSCDRFVMSWHSHNIDNVVVNSFCGDRLYFLLEYNALGFLYSVLEK